MTTIKSETARLKNIILAEEDVALGRATLIGLPINISNSVCSYDYYHCVLYRLKKELIDESIRLDYPQFGLFQKFWAQSTHDNSISEFHCWITLLSESQKKEIMAERDATCNFGSCCIL